MRLDDLLHRTDIPADALEIIRGHLEAEATASGRERATSLEREQFAALDCIGDSVVYYRDASLKVAWANRAAQALAGADLGAPGGRTCYRLRHDRNSPGRLQKRTGP